MIAATLIHRSRRRTAVISEMDCLVEPRDLIDLSEQRGTSWAMDGGDASLVIDLIPGLASTLVQASGVQRGDRVLDLAAGAGSAAGAAAQAGAEVEEFDLTTRERRAETLPFADGQFDNVLSCIAITSAPQHARFVDELLRVCRPGGSIGLLSWTPEGFPGKLAESLGRYTVPAQRDATRPASWGRPECVRGILGDRVEGLSAVKRSVRVTRFAEPSAFRDYVKTHHGPTIAAYRAISGDTNLVAELDRDLTLLMYSARSLERGAATNAVEWEYLIVTAQKRADAQAS
jgi:SAM-dependent methyltransferase